MHEYHLAKIVLDSVLKNINPQEIKRVTRIFLEVGVSKMVTPTSLQEAFSLVARSSPAAGAILEIKDTMGDSLVVKSIEVENSKE
jgi:Zn finger protein HypA/HybF involved in hydrogenase expression